MHSDKFDDEFDDDFDDLDEFDDEFDDEGLDDLDDLEALDDDFETAFEDEGTWDEKEGVVKPPPSAANPGPAAQMERTFLQKYFNFIVIAIVLIMGGLWYMGQSRTPPQPMPQQSQNETTNQQAEAPDQEQASDPDASEELDMLEQMMSGNEQRNEQSGESSEDLPMPVPINTAANNTPEQQASPSILTPMPVENPSLYGEPSEQEQDSLPKVEQALEESPGMKLPGFEKMASEDALVEKSEFEKSLDGQKEELVIADKKKTAEIQKEIDGVKSEIAGINQELGDKISQTDNKIEELVDMMQKLQQKIDKMASNEVRVVKEVPATPVEDHAIKTISNRENKSEPAQQKTDEQAASAQTPAPQPAPATIKKTTTRKVSWDLRSAQPGKAVVVRRGSNDFQTVEVGDSLSGIGRIKSISMENGQWVVRGTSGQIRR